MYRWSTCPGSIKHMQDNPMPSSSHADEGTKAHAAAEYYLNMALNGYSNEPCPEIDDEMEGYVITYVNYCLDLVENDFAVEQMFTLKGVCDEAFGTNDFCCWEDFGHLHICDLKYGIGVEVQAEENKQLMYYALGSVIENDLDVDKITLHVIQPRIEDPIKTWTIDYARLMEFKEVVREAIASAKSQPELRVPGNHCRFCNKAQCPEFMDNMYKETTVEVTDTISLGNPREMTVDRLANILKHEDLVKQFLTDAKVLYQNLAESGLVDPADHGMKLVESRGNTAFKDPDNVPFRKLGIPKDQCFNTKLKTATQIKKLLPKDKLDAFDNLVERPLRGYKLVSLKAKGEPVKTIAEDTIQL